MIDLRIKELPSYIECDGIFYPVKTDFRVWIDFGFRLERNEIWGGIFEEEIPNSLDWVSSAIEFYKSENVTPKDNEKPSGRTLDLVLDGDYIVASFQAAYGIDLTSCDMHWHRFHALLIGLPEDTKLSQIMGYRAYRHRGKIDQRAEMNKLKNAWTLPAVDYEERKKALLDWADDFFG